VFSRDGDKLAASADREVYVWHLATGDRIGRPDKTLRVWDVATRQPVGHLLQGHKDVVYSAAFSPDGKTLASGSGNALPTASKSYTLRLWDVAKRQPLGEPLQGQNSFVLSLAFSPDGKTLASGSHDKRCSCGT
jgi:WD40 repeat protein